MKHLKYFFLWFNLILVACIPQEDGPQQQIDFEFKAISNVAYGEHERQVYDIYLPANRNENTSTILLLHGGGWMEGNKSDMNPFKDFLRDQLPGYAVVNMNYRLADQNHSPYPMQLEDITSLISHLESNRDDYQIGEKLGFVGASAGGHLALLWSYTRDVNEQVQMVCSIVGPTNLLDEAYLNTQNSELKGMLDLFGADEEMLRAASPLFQLQDKAPPTILFYGGKDPLIPNSQGISLKERLEELQVIHEFHFYPNEGHGWIGLNLLDSSLKLKAFIEKNF
ncbi:alpha/beta hydrolase [Cyclobacterium plantarum]|uniref:Alpha/beta hydrolase n=1 Tax=Cyclobacterium plantarum TaxID=2716263 RepID=A0ABX0HCJ6_9BACT|nr:alpha/beta hydrolase [Cyclobacterium plantarum]NHE59609.1 alpha/beta hydrolase [Cyclobacterium plantarum]